MLFSQRFRFIHYFNVLTGIFVLQKISFECNRKTNHIQLSFGSRHAHGTRGHKWTSDAAGQVQFVGVLTYTSQLNRV